MDVVTPVLSLVLEPRVPADREKLVAGIKALMSEDPILHARIDEHTGRTVIAGMGELHLEIVVDRLSREFGVDAAAGPARVIYKETLTRAADGEMKYVRQTGRRGQYGHVKIHLFPGKRGTGYVFDNEITPDGMPKEFVNAVREGIQEALARGILAGCAIDDVRIQLYDGSYHDVDSSEMAFKIAGSMAFHDAAKRAVPVLLEPVMRVEVTAPEEYMEDVLGDLAARRAHVQSQEERGAVRVIRARVPLADMLGYATDLRLQTGGRATFVMFLDCYQPLRQDPGAELDELPVRAPRAPAPTRVDSVSLPEPDTTK